MLLIHYIAACGQTQWSKKYFLTFSLLVFRKMSYDYVLFLVLNNN